MMNGNDTDILIINDKQQGDTQTDGKINIALGEVDSLLTSISSKDITNNTMTEPKLSDVTKNVESAYIPKIAMSTKYVRD